MTDWNGAFLRKHVVAVEYVEKLPPNREAEVEGSTSSRGYFKVTFDDDGHGGGSYYYPAEPGKIESFKSGDLDPTEFYGW